MLDHKYVEGFTFQEFCYLSLGALVFGLPWLLIPSFWDRVITLNILAIIVAEIIIIIFLFALLFSLAYGKYEPKKAFNFALRKFIVIFISTVFIAAAALVVFGLVSLEATASVFGKTVLTTHIATVLSAVAFDLLMNK